MPPEHRTKRGPRRKAREKALQILFQIDATGDGVAEGSARYWEQFPAGAEARRYAQELVDLVDAHAADIDAMLAAASEHWTLERMSAVDRSLLRLAAAELRYIQDVPPKVTINEAVEIAKDFSTPEGCKFVNGVLDRILASLNAETE